jgi:polyvinyl alcohol dehydrogenase (cytochrome)
MRRVLLVTVREYRRMIALPAFWIISLLIPLIVAAAPLAENLFSRSPTVGYVLVDKSGRYTAPINQRVDLDYQRQVLINILGYAQRWRAGTAAPAGEGAGEAESSSSLSDAAVRNFVAAGGAPAVLRLLKPTLLPTAPVFYAPPRSFVELPLADGVATDSADRFGASIAPHFQESSRTPTGEAALRVAIYIPDNVDSGGQIRVWTSGEAGARLIQDLRLELTQGLRLEGLRAAGVDPLSAAQIENLSVPISIAPPHPPAGGGHAVIHSALPLVLTGLLLASMFITGSMMLQGLVEERSNKLLEAVLACVSAGEFLVGKLLGISAIGLSIIGIWLSATFGILYAAPSSPLGFLVPAFTSISQTPGIAAAIIFYFLAGHLTIGMIFLAAGAVSASMRDVQGYLMPLGLLVAVPATGLVNLVYRDPNGLVTQIFSWIPLYTPMIMLARLQNGVSAFEIFGTTIALLAFGSVELLLLWRLFENKLIQTGQGFRVAPKTWRTVSRVAALCLVMATAAVIVRHNRISAPPHQADQTVALHTRGETVFKAACARCHEPASGRAPDRQQLASFAPDKLVAALTSGVMKTMAASLSEADMRAVATYLTGRQPVGSSAAAADPPACPKPATFTMQGSGWNGWSTDPRNWRFQPNPGLSASDVPRLDVKWAFSYVGGKYGQPTVVGGRLFLTSMSGAVYSLDAKTGCMFWRFNESAPSRTTVSVGPAPSIAPSGYAVYFGDLSANVYAVDAATGVLLWKTRVDAHPRSVLTGAPTLFKDRLYVPVSSWEEAVASAAHYSCCTFRGSVVALDAATGRIDWTAFAIEQAPTPTRQNSAGTQMYGPAGAAVWSAPTIDAKRNRMYFATGNSYTDAIEGGSDAVIAVDLASGTIIWRRQFIRGDNDLSGCGHGTKLVNCPTMLGHDYDFGASPILMTLETGRDVLLAGQKSGAVFGIEPDTGNVLWRTQVGVGGFLGGVEWGMASDGARLYVANADVVTAENGRPGLFALDPATGKDLWYQPSPRVGCHWQSGIPCFDAQSAAPSAVPGVIFAGTMDGHERAYASANGNVLWDFDTVSRTYRTINGVSDQTGGPLDVSSGTIADGMLFLTSGYLGIAGGGTDNVLLAFSVDGR